MKERIQKILASAGIASRRKIEDMIRQGRVAVNGKITVNLPILIDPQRDKVAIDDEPLAIKSKDVGKRLYILMYKPKGVYSTNVAQGEQTRAIDLLPHDLPGRVYPVGRLDAESKGLLLLTNDGDLTNRLTHPRFGVPKTYKATVDGFVEGGLIEQLAKGVWVADPKSGKGFRTGKSQIKIVNRTRQSTVLEITLRETRNLQMRRILAKLGHKVRDLVRTKIGPLTLHGMSPGDSRELSPKEVRQLRKFGQEHDRARADDAAGD